jgi:hypothetical protein
MSRHPAGGVRSGRGVLAEDGQVVAGRRGHDEAMPDGVLVRQAGSHVEHDTDAVEDASYHEQHQPRRRDRGEQGPGATTMTQSSRR